LAGTFGTASFEINNGLSAVSMYVAGRTRPTPVKID
jgi:hypothetical protein